MHKATYTTRNIRVERDGSEIATSVIEQEIADHFKLPIHIIDSVKRGQKMPFDARVEDSWTTHLESALHVPERLVDVISDSTGVAEIDEQLLWFVYQVTRQAKRADDSFWEIGISTDIARAVSPDWESYYSLLLQNDILEHVADPKKSSHKDYRNPLYVDIPRDMLKGKSIAFELKNVKFRQRIWTQLWKRKCQNLSDWETRVPLVESLNQFHLDTKALLNDNKQGKLTLNKYDLAAIHASSKQIVFRSICEYGQRLHTSLTNLNKICRSYLRKKGSIEQLVEVDIKNSQPLFLSLLQYIDLEKLPKHVLSGFDERHLDAIKAFQSARYLSDVNHFTSLSRKR